MSQYPRLYDRPGYCKPSKATITLIKAAIERLNGYDRYNIYSICKEVDKLAEEKYTGKNYVNQLQRMGITRSGHYLGKIEWYLINEI